MASLRFKKIFQKDLFSCSIIYLFNLLYRFLLLFKMEKFPNFYCPNPTMDADFYLFLVKLVKMHSPLIEKQPYYYSPLFLYYLYGLNRIFGESVYAIRISNMLLGSTVPIFIFLIAKKVFEEKRYAFLASAAATFFDLFLFYDVQISKVTLGITFITLGLYFLIKDGKERDLILAGLFLGLSSLVYGTILAFILVFSIYVGKRDLKRSFYFLIFPTALVAACTIRNYIYANDFVPITASDGLHFYIGNSRFSKGIYTIIPGIRPNAFGHYFDAKRYAEIRLKRSLKPSQVSLFFKKMALKDICRYPKNTLKLYLKKFLLLLNYYDIPNNVDIHFFRDNLPILRFTLQFWIVLSFGAVGFIFADFMRFSVLIIFFVTYFASICLFFINDRYRLPLAIPLIIFSSNFAKELFESSGRKRFCMVVLLSCMLAITSLDLHIPKGFFRHATLQRMRISRDICFIKEEIKKTRDERRKRELFLRLAVIYENLGGKEWADYYLKEAARCSSFRSLR